jgi:hypothetical protein
MITQIHRISSYLASFRFMRTKASLIVFILICSNCFAQEEIKSSHRYFNLFQTGALLGEKDRGTSFTFSTVHGIQRKSFRVGLGTGFDSYQRWRVVPVFAYLSFDLANIRDNHFFIALASGPSKAWYREQDDPSQMTYSDGSGMTFLPSIGYRIKADKWRLYITAGYKWQRVNYTSSPSWWWGPDQPSYSVEEEVERVSVQLGFGIN